MRVPPPQDPIGIADEERDVSERRALRRATALIPNTRSYSLDGEPVAELGPGTIAGERSGLEGGIRTATLRARSACNIAVVPPDAFATTDLEAIAAGRRREE